MPTRADRHADVTWIAHTEVMESNEATDSGEPVDTSRYRTLFLSDIHLGAKACQAEALLSFLRYHDADTIYLVGDIVDGWRLRSSWYWPQSHNDVVQKLLRKARKGTRIIYLPGNHDEFLRDFYGTHFGGIEVCETAIHETAAGKRYLVIHGDVFDIVVTNARWLAHLGDWAYDAAIWLNRHISAVRRKMGLPYWSFSAWSKVKVKNAVSFIARFEATLATEARKRGTDGVVCGHIHCVEMRDIDGLAYVNTGDWVESCTAIAERADGSLEIIRWPAEPSALFRRTPPARQMILSDAA